MSRVIQALLASPSRAHLDAFGVSLMLLGASTVVFGGGSLLRVRRRWPHDPFRQLIFRSHSVALLLSGLLLLGFAGFHAAGIPVYGAPIHAVAALLLLVAVATYVRLSSLLHYRALITRYDTRYFWLAGGRANLPRARPPRDEWRLLGAAAGGAGLYLAFSWHPWNHVFHIGLMLVGALAGYAIGGLVGAYRYGVPAVTELQSSKSQARRDSRGSAPKHQKRRRR